MTKNFNPEEYIIFEGMAGSHLYGTNTIDSDVDTRGVVVPPMNVLLDPFNEFNVKDSFDGGEDDRALYSIKKFFKLCADNNPNVLELLFVPPDKTTISSPYWEKIVENRHLFLSKNIKHRFLGYAFSQLEKIKRHREWFINPPHHKPSREEFGLTQSPIATDSVIQNAFGIPQHVYKDEYREELSREREYREAKKRWDSYATWKKERNPKRRGSEELFGYDTKCALHLFRLMIEGKSLLLGGEIKFPLPEADWLLQIKNGKYSFEKIVEMAQSIETNFNAWYDMSSLPKAPNRKALTSLYMEIVNERNL